MFYIDCFNSLVCEAPLKGYYIKKVIIIIIIILEIKYSPFCCDPWILPVDPLWIPGPTLITTFVAYGSLNWKIMFVWFLGWICFVPSCWASCCVLTPTRSHFHHEPAPHNSHTLSCFVCLWFCWLHSQLSVFKQQDILPHLFALELQLLSQCFDFYMEHFDFSFIDNWLAGERTERVGERDVLEFHGISLWESEGGRTAAEREKMCELRPESSLHLGNSSSSWTPAGSHRLKYQVVFLELWNEADELIFNLV